MKCILNKLTILLLLLTQIVVGQWNKGKNNGYYKLSASSLVANEHFTSAKIKDPNATRGNFVISAYGEYGLTSKIDIITYVPLFSRVYQNKQVSATTGGIIQDGESLNSIGDIELGFRHKIFKNDHLAVSGTLKLGLPTGDSNGGGDGSFQTGDGEFNQLIQLDLGIPFKVSHHDFYIKVYSAFNNRNKGFSDEYHFGGELGTKINSKIFLASKFNNVRSLYNGDLTGTGQGVFANNIEQTNLSAEFAYYFTSKFGLSLSYTAILSGKITYAASVYAVGLFWDVK